MLKKTSIGIRLFATVFIILPSAVLISLLVASILNDFVAFLIVLFLFFMIIIGMGIGYSKSLARRLFLFVCPVYYYLLASCVDFIPTVKKTDILIFYLMVTLFLSFITIFIFTRPKVKEQFK
jgi:hypothetical protein